MTHHNLKELGILFGHQHRIPRTMAAPSVPFKIKNCLGTPAVNRGVVKELCILITNPGTAILSHPYFC
jgi:hypothetical protein